VTGATYENERLANTDATDADNVVSSCSPHISHTGYNVFLSVQQAVNLMTLH